MAETLNLAVLRDLQNQVGADMIPKLLVSVRIEIATTVEIIKKLMAVPDLPDVKLHAHRIKASCQTVGMNELGACAEQLELAARDNDPAKAMDSAERLPALAKSAILAANDYLKGIGFNEAD